MQEALKNEEYEQAAGHIYRYLTLDENTLRKTVEDSDDLEGELGYCVLVHVCRWYSYL